MAEPARIYCRFNFKAVPYVPYNSILNCKVISPSPALLVISDDSICPLDSIILIFER